MTAEREVVGACPLDCPDGCSWVVTVRDEAAVRLRGNRDHPFTHGTLCVKVNQYLEHAAAPDRLHHPLRRTGAKGEGRFERISWDEALTEIADRLASVRERWGGEAIWPYQGTGNLGYLQGLQGRAGARLWNVLGASRHEVTICSFAGLAGARYATGTTLGIDPESLAESKLILLWGVNTLTSGHHLWRFVERARARGAHVVAVDPVRTRTARQADEHVAPLPGTDAALALGLLNVVVSLGREDARYLAENTVGWPEFRRRVLEFTPSRVAAITGVDEAQLVRLGRRLAETRPTAIRAGVGVQRHAGGGEVLRVLSCVPGVTGDWQYHGGGLAYSTDGYFGGDRAALARDDLLEAPVRTLLMTRLGEGLLDLDDPPVKALVVYAANPLTSAPGQDRIRRGLAREDLFTVVIDLFRTDTADYADLVLPATMQTEHLDVHDGYGHLYVAWNEPAVAPPGECLSTTETFRRLAAKMGLTEPSLYDSDEELARQLLEVPHPSLAGITVAGLREKGWARLNYPPSFVPFEAGFPTPSGKLEFRSELAGRDGLDPLAGYTPPFENDDRALARRFPLILVAGASHFFVNTVFGNKPALARRAGPPRVVLHPEDAGERAIADGQRVRVVNDRGSFTALARVDTAVRRGVVATTKGHWAKLTGGGPGINATVAERDSDLGGAVFSDNRVEIEAVATR
ncbi:molybdopterin-containing oxidoreductase family protein [Amycolatopsis sp. CA-230715]|uniref:molybdopterin-containing oxidoreductase family protein n=1 Tax=Amycolatopsis sp. CA-230715 TaxID=2745196 RepID=UPI001C02A23D|nr:molybdopterin-dependent oxidoreductase [Amycolatopsis sp. CA-230715]QWF78888.1 Dimethyl sulfoxide reductase DmsA [Amycolatopsis sp. CA-230715]